MMAEDVNFDGSQRGSEQDVASGNRCQREKRYHRERFVSMLSTMNSYYKFIEKSGKGVQA